MATIEAATRQVQGWRHSAELQSMRGLAAPAVVLAHASGYFVLPAIFAAGCEFLFNASAAVLCFFVLSGFVLTLSQVDRPLGAGSVGIFYLRRLFRIYPALWLATALALAYYQLAPVGGWPASVSPHWAEMARDRLGAKALIETLAGKDTPLALPIWTLWIELIGSALMPLAIFAVNWAPWLLVPMFVLCVAAGSSPRTNVYGAPAFLTCFLYGAALVPLIPRVRQGLRSHGAARGLALAGLAPLWFGSTLFGLVPYQPFALSSVMVTGLGAAIVVAAIYARPAAFRTLARPAFAWPGDVSYSLYLLHMPIIGLVGLVLLRLLGRGVADHVTAAAAVLTAATLLLAATAAHFSYRFVELAGVRAGKRAIARLQARGGPSLRKPA